MLITPEISINAISETLVLFMGTVLPSLFPFILCTQVLIMLNGAKVIGFPLLLITRLLGYDDNVAGAYAASLVGGYPIGASSLNLLYNQNMLQGNYLAYMLLCSNCGPMFTLATIGTIMLGSYRIGLIIFITHALAALLTSIIANMIKSDSNPRKDTKPDSINKRINADADIFEIIERAVINTARIMIKIFGLLCFFRLISDTIFANGLIFADAVYFQIIARGALEMVDGCVNAAGLGAKSGALAISFIISFGGLSAIFQSISVSRDLPYSKKLFVLGKLLHGFLSIIICYILLSIIPVSVPTSSFVSSYNIYTGLYVPQFTFVIIGISVIYLVVNTRCHPSK